MNIKRNRSDSELAYADVVQDEGNTDYVLDGVIYKNSPVKNVMVSDADDLDLLEDYEPCTIAYTAGYTNIWQKDVDGEWVAIVGSEEGDS